MPSPAPSSAAMGTRVAAPGAEVVAVTDRATSIPARTESAAIMTVHGRQRSLARPPTRRSAVRGTP